MKIPGGTPARTQPGGPSDPTRKVVPEMLLTPILPFSQAPLVVGLDTEGTQIQPSA
jgi:hypothetical protein